MLRILLLTQVCVYVFNIVTYLTPKAFTVLYHSNMPECLRSFPTSFKGSFPLAHNNSWNSDLSNNNNSKFLDLANL